MASQLGLASGSVPGLEPESALASDSVPGLEPESALASVMPMASQALESAWVPGLASGSVPGLEPESVPVWARESGLPTVPAWVPDLASG